MGDELSTYRRTPKPERRPPPGPLPTGRRLVVIVVGLVVLAVLAGIAIAIGGDDDTAGGPGDTATTSPTGTDGPAIGGQAPDVVVARQILPATLGPGWIEVSREPEPVPADVDPDDACARRAQPVQEGLVTRAAFDKVGATVTERASLVSGVVTEGTTVPALDDDGVVDCLHEGLAPQVGDGNELVAVEQDLPPAPEGAELSGARFEEVDADGEARRRFELLLLQRDRAVTFALVVVDDLDRATPVEDLVAALDAPLEAGAARLN